MPEGLGQGAFGTVFLVEDEPSQERYALKRVSQPVFLLFARFVRAFCMSRLSK